MVAADRDAAHLWPAWQSARIVTRHASSRSSGCGDRPETIISTATLMSHRPAATLLVADDGANAHPPLASQFAALGRQSA